MILRLSRAAVLGLAFLASACSLGPLDQAPEMAAPTDWTAKVEGVGAWPDRQWWRSFGSAELGELIAAAQANNRDVAAAVQRIRQAEAQLRVAGAALQPSVSADAGIDRTWHPSGGTSRTAVTNYQAGLTASYQVDVFGGNAAGANAAASRLDSVRYDREAVMITLQASVAISYLQLLSLRDRMNIAGETLRISQETLRVLTRQRDLGSATELEVAQQRSVVASQRAAIVGLQQSEKVTLDALAVLVGRAPQGFTANGRSLTELTLPGFAAGLPSELLQRRPDLRRAEANLRAANFDITAARAARYPSFDLSARASLAATALTTFLDPAAAALSIGGSLAAPILDGGRLKAQEDAAAARFRELAEAYQGAFLAALRDTEDALGASVASREQYELTVEAYEQAREAYRIADARYRAGSVPFINVLDALRTLFQNQDAMVHSSLARFTSVVDLYEALGGGWDGSTTAAR